MVYKLSITGTVQGVGFRPFVYKLAHSKSIFGTIYNSPSGVEVYLQATKEQVDAFVQDMYQNLPPLASIDSLDISLDSAEDRFDSFYITQSHNSGDTIALIPPDISICQECQKELFDSSNRRYLYPFITCTNCGVRYSIIEDLPYDRAKTSMKFFKMCEKCQAEYNNPLDRRYHAQPIGCWECGPTLVLIDNVGRSIPTPTPIDETVKLLLDGKIIAIKGVGGYHLVCDATNEKAIQKLRDRKHRPTKPFAVMVRDITMARELAKINKKEEELLTSKERPIVLLQSVGVSVGSQVICNSSQSNKLQITRPLALGIAPDISRIGIFLPYTPLHLLILKKLNRPLVATSANVTDEPIATNKESIERLSNVYDYLLDHNREIVNGCDDSVVMVVEDRTIFIRRARGYTPVSIKLPFSLPQKVLAVGANQKSTIAIGFDDQVILSPHIGDLDGIASVEYFKENIENLKRIYKFEPEVVVHDKHPNYESTKYAKSLPIEKKETQHHYAHILATMVEAVGRGVLTPTSNSQVLGVAFDGTGYGDDGNLWGGEFMVCDFKGYERVAHLSYFKLLGGAKAIKEPRRVALSLLFDIYGKDAISLDNSTIKSFTPQELKTHYLMWQKGLNAPLSSSVGRLFDAVASLTGVCQVMSFEGESGMQMEEFYDSSIKECYPFTIDKEIDILPMIEAISQEPNAYIAISKFFNTLVEMIYTIYQEYQLPLVLSGGVFQNRILLQLILDKIPQAIIPSLIPPNDGSIALGQLVVSNGLLHNHIKRSND